MSKIIDYLYHGDFENATDRAGCLDRLGIKSIVSVIDGQGYDINSRARLLADSRGPNKDIEYLHIDIDDSPDQFIDVHFEKALNFIHQARLAKKTVLVHCMLGMSRSTTIVVAYLMTITNLDWQTCLNAVRKRRPKVEPNEGFIRQLAEYQILLSKLLANRTPSSQMQQYRNYPLRENDIKAVRQLDEK